jgi:hypothetical protein
MLSLSKHGGHAPLPKRDFFPQMPDFVRLRDVATVTRWGTAGEGILPTGAAILSVRSFSTISVARNGQNKSRAAQEGLVRYLC